MEAIESKGKRTRRQLPAMTPEELEDVRQKPAITPLELARIYGIGERTAYSMVERGEVKAAKIGGTWRINTRCALELLEL